MKGRSAKPDRKAQRKKQVAKRPVNVAKMTQEYIGSHASVKECARRGLVNFSALAREICTEHGLDRFEAVLAACQRYSRRLQGQVSQERRVLALLRRAKIQVNTKVSVFNVDRPKDLEPLFALQREMKQAGESFALIEGREGMSLVVGNEYSDDITEAFKGRVKKVSTDVVQITMIFDRKIETTPGVVAYIYGRLADSNINVLEEMSCWTELMMVVEEEDLPRALRLLKF